MHLAVGLEGAGWHPAAWREPDARPAELFTARYWLDLVREAESGLLDFVTIEDSLVDGPEQRVDRVRGRLDAVLIASRVAPRTTHIGLVPTAVVTHTEPFHLSKAIATLDYVSSGRAGFQVRISTSRYDAAHFGRRPAPDRAEACAEAAHYVEVVRRLWDSWEDDAEIRDVATGRFVDREKLHYIDFEGPFFSVKGPSITPRPPQGQPLVVAPAELGVEADVALVAPARAADAEAAHAFGDVLVFLDEVPGRAADRKARLDELAGAELDAVTFAGTPGELADELIAWQAAGLSGFRLRPGAIPHDLTEITRKLVPLLQARGAFRNRYSANTLRGLLGLGRPVNRYVSTKD